MNPLKFKMAMDYLTRIKKVKPDLPDVFPASQAPMPPKKESLETMEAINRFVRDNPRQEKAGGGMLVQPGFGGTRQGYREDLLSEVPKKFTEDLLEKRISIGRTIGPTPQAVTVGELFETVKNVKGGPELISDFKKNPTEEKFLNLRKKYKNRVKTERIQNLSPKEKEKFRQRVINSERKWRRSEKGKAYYNKLNATKGIFPAITEQERVWRDIYRAASQKKQTSRFKIIYPKNVKIDSQTGLPKAIKSAKGNMYIPWDQYYKQISFYDTNTNSTIKFNNIREWMKNNVKNGGKKYDNAIQNYTIRQSISDFNIGDETLGSVFKQSKVAAGASPTSIRLASPAAVNHRSILDNFWDTEVTTTTANQQLNEKVQSKISAYKNAKNPLEKNRILKQMNAEINKIKGGASLVLDRQTIGRQPTLRKVTKALEKELNVKINLKELENRILQNTISYSKKPECKVNLKADGGRIGFANSIDCIQDGLKEQKLSAQKGNKKAAQELIEISKVASRGALLKNVLGPGALLGEAVYEGAVIGNKVLGGTPADIAYAESYLSYLDPRKYRGELDPTTLKREDMLTREIEDEEGNVIKKITAPGNIPALKSGFAAQDQISAFEKAIEERDRAARGGKNIMYAPAAAEAREQGARVDQSANIISSDSFKDASKIAQEFIQGQAGRQMADIGAAAVPQSVMADETRRLQAMREMKNLYPQYSDEDIIQIIKDSNLDPKDYDYTLTPKTVEGKPLFPAAMGVKPITGFDAVRDFLRQQDQMQAIADAGGVANLAGGGIAKLAGIDKGPQRVSMNPDSQGLQGLMKRVKRI